MKYFFIIFMCTVSDVLEKLIASINKNKRIDFNIFIDY